jgi:hypothetical protein
VAQGILRPFDHALASAESRFKNSFVAWTLICQRKLTNACTSNRDNSRMFRSLVQAGRGRGNLRRNRRRNLARSRGGHDVWAGLRQPGGNVRRRHFLRRRRSDYVRRRGGNGFIGLGRRHGSPASGTELPRAAFVPAAESDTNRNLPDFAGSRQIRCFEPGKPLASSSDRHSPTRIASNSGFAGGPRTMTIVAYNLIRV